MSATIDTRIVEMRFENSQFKDGVKETLNDLDELKEGLDFEGASDSLENIEKAAKSFSLKGVEKAVSDVSVSFSTLQLVALNTLNNIANRISNAGINLVKSFTIDPVTSGWQKYADITSSVQTILNATGEDMSYVQEQIDKLNLFTDETSFNLMDMVDNVGKFTSNNIGLADAVTYMEGIATWGAYAGSNAYQISNAMRNVSQSIGMGYMGLQDWISIENAQMATSQFKELAIQTGIAMGAISEGQVTVENFRSTLNQRWLSTEVLTAVLESYGKFATDILELSEETDISVTDLLEGIDAATSESVEDWKLYAKSLGLVDNATGELTEDAQVLYDILGPNGLGSNDEIYKLSRDAFIAAQQARTFKDAMNAVSDATSTAWSRIFQIIFGNVEEAKKLWTNLANDLWEVFAGPLVSIGDYLEGWKALDGFAEDATESEDVFINFWEGLRNIFLAIQEVVRNIGVAIGNVFQAIDPNDAKAWSRNFVSWTEDIVSAVANGGYKVIPIVEAFLAPVVLLKDILGGLLAIVKPILSAVVSAIESIAGIAFDGAYQVSILGGTFSEMIDDVRPFTSLGKKIGDVLGAILTPLTDLVKAVSSFTGAFLFDTIIPIARDVFADILQGTTSLLSVLGDLKPVLSDVFNDIIDLMRPIATDLGEKLKNFVKQIPTWISNISSNVSNFYQNNKPIFDKLKEVLDSLWDTVKNVVSAVYEGAKKIGPVVSPILEGIWSKLQTLWDTVKGYLPSADRVQEFLNDTLDFIIGIAPAVTSAISTMVGWLGDAVSFLADFFGFSTDSNVAEDIEDIANAASDVTEAITDATEAFVPLITGGRGSLGSGNRVMNAATINIRRFGEGLEDAAESSEDLESSFRGFKGFSSIFEENFLTPLSNISQAIKNTNAKKEAEKSFEDIFSFLGDGKVKDKVAGFFEDTNFASVARMVGGIGSILAASSMASSVSSVASGFEGIGSALSAFAGNTLGGQLLRISGSMIIFAKAIQMMDNIGMNKVADGFKEIAKGIGLLTAIDFGADKLGDAASLATGKLFGNKDFVGTSKGGINSTGLFGVAIAVWILADALGRLSKLDKVSRESMDNARDAIESITTVVASAMAILTFIRKIPLAKAAKSGGKVSQFIFSADNTVIDLLAIVGSVFLIIKAIEYFVKVTKDIEEEDLNKARNVISHFVGLLGLVAGLLGGYGNTKSTLTSTVNKLASGSFLGNLNLSVAANKTADIIFSIAVAIGVIIGAVYLLAKMYKDDAANTQKALDEVNSILSVVIGVVAVISILFAVIGRSSKTAVNTGISGAAKALSLPALINSVGLLILSIVGSLFLIVKLFRDNKDMTGIGGYSDELWLAISIIAGLLSLIIIMVSVMSSATSELTSNANLKQFLGIGVVLWAIGKAIRSITISMVLLTQLAGDNTSLWSAFGVLAGSLIIIIGGVAAMLAIVKSKDIANIGFVDNTFKALSGVALAVVSFGAALLLFAISAKIIEGIDKTALEYTGGALAAMMASIIAILLIIKKGNFNIGSAKAVLNAGKSVLMIAASLLVIAAAMWAVSSIPINGQEDWNKIWTMAGFLAAIMIFVGVASGFKLGKDALKLAGSVAIVSVSLVIIASALAIVSNIEIGWGTLALVGMLVLVTVGLMAFVKAMKKVDWGSMIKAGIGIGAAMVVVLAVTGLLALINHMGEVNWEALGAVGLMVVVMGALVGLLGSSPQISAGAIAIGAAVLLLAAGIWVLVQAIIDFAVAFGYIDPPAVSRTIGQSIDSATNALDRHSGKFNNSLNNLLDVDLSEGSNSLSTNMQGAAQNGLGSFLGTLENGTGDVNGVLGNLVSPDSTVLSGLLGNAESLGSEIGSAIGNSISSWISNSVNNTLTNLKEAVSDFIHPGDRITPEMVTKMSGSSHANGSFRTAEEIEESANRIKDSTKDFYREFDNFTGAVKAWWDFGKQQKTSNKLEIISFEEVDPAVDANIPLVVEEIGEVFDENAPILKDSGTTVGEYYGKGMVSGVTSWLPAIFKVGRLAAKQLETGSKTGLEEKSPSKVAIGIGKFFDEGLIIGVEEDTKMVCDATSHLGTKMSLSALNPLKNVRGAMHDAEDDISDFRDKTAEIIDSTKNAADSATYETGEGLIGTLEKVGNFFGLTDANNELSQYASTLNSLMSGDFSGMEMGLTIVAEDENTETLLGMLSGDASFDEYLQLNSGKNPKHLEHKDSFDKIAQRTAASINANGPWNLDTTGAGSNYSYVQNIYSPKALSRIDIYRQTRNQLAYANWK